MNLVLELSAYYIISRPLPSHTAHKLRLNERKHNNGKTVRVYRTWDPRGENELSPPPYLALSRRHPAYTTKSYLRNPSTTDVERIWWYTERASPPVFSDNVMKEGKRCGRVGARVKHKSIVQGNKRAIDYRGE